MAEGNPYIMFLYIQLKSALAAGVLKFNEGDEMQMSLYRMQQLSINVVS